MIIHILFVILLLSFPIKDSTKVKPNLRYKSVTSKFDSLETKVKMIKFKIDSLKQRKK